MPIKIYFAERNTAKANNIRKIFLTAMDEWVRPTHGALSYVETSDAGAANITVHWRLYDPAKDWDDNDHSQHH